MLKIMQSKISILLLCLTALCFSSCGNSLSIKKTDLSVDIPSQVFEQVSERSAYSETWMPINAKIELFVNDKVYALDSQEYLEGNEASVKFLFKDIPVNSKAYAKISISQDDIPLANGQSTTITIKSGKNELVIPVELVKYSVPRTKYMLRRIGEIDNTYDCFLRDKPDAVIVEEDEPDFKNVVKYCFDKDGFVYVIVAKQTMYTYGDPLEEYYLTNYYVESNKNNFESIHLYDSNSSYQLIQLFCDVVTNKVYVMYHQEDLYVLIDVENNSQKEGSFALQLPIQPEDSYADPCCIISNDSKTYCLYKAHKNDGEDYYLVKMNLHEAQSLSDIEFSSPLKINFNLEQYPDLDLDFNDIIYQDGCFYVLVSTRPRESGIITGFGGIIRINYEKAEVKMLGFTSSVYSFRDGGKMRVYGNNGETHPVYKSNKTDYLEYTYSELDPDKNGAFDKQVYTPKSADTESFFKPDVLVALKPKQLVLLDTGKYFFIDTDEYWKYKNVNRIITIDLDTFTIKKIMQTNIEGAVDNGLYEAGDIDSYFIRDLNVYYDPENGSDYVPITISNDSGWHYYIPSADN